MSDQPPHLQVETTDRGFGRLPPIPSEYGGDIRVYQSSSAEAAKLWIAARSPVDMNEWARLGDAYEGGWNEAHIHVRIEVAQQFAEQIMHIVELG